MFDTVTRPPLLSMAAELRQKAATAKRLAAYIPADPAADLLRKLSVELENRAATIEAENRQDRMAS